MTNEKSSPLKPSVQCDTCGKSLSSSSLRKHQKEVHMKIRKFQCKSCDKFYVRNSTLMLHIKNVQQNICENYECDLCG